MKETMRESFEETRQLDPNASAYRTFAIHRTSIADMTIDPVDALSICQDVLTELKPFQRAAVVAFLREMVSA